MQKGFMKKTPAHEAERSHLERRRRARDKTSVEAHLTLAQGARRNATRRVAFCLSLSNSAAVGWHFWGRFAPDRQLKENPTQLN